MEPVKADKELVLPGLVLARGEEQQLILEKLDPLTSGIHVVFSRDDWPDGVGFDLVVEYRQRGDEEWREWIREPGFGSSPVDRWGKKKDFEFFEAEWGGENPNAAPKSERARNTRKMLCMQQVRIRLLRDALDAESKGIAAGVVSMKSFLLPGAKEITDQRDAASVK